MVPHFSSLNPKCLSFPLRQGVLISYYGSLRRHTSMRSIFKEKESANQFLFHLEEIISKQSRGHYARTIREGDIVFILQLGSNAHGTFLMVSELLHGRRKGNIVTPKGRLGSG